MQQLIPTEQLSCITVSWDNLFPPIDQELKKINMCRYCHSSVLSSIPTAEGNWL